MARLCLAENRRPWAPDWVGDHRITAHAGVHNAITADLVAPGGHVFVVYSSSVTDAEWAPRITIACTGWQRRSLEATRDVLPPLIVDGIQHIVGGGTAWGKLPVEFWSTGTVNAVSARRIPVHETRPETHRNGLRIWISTNTVCTRQDTGIRTIRCSLRYPFGSVDGT